MVRTCPIRTRAETTRTFVALRPSARQHAAVHEAIDRLAHADVIPEGTKRTPVRWADPATVHLTLAFLGGLDRAEVRAATEIVREVAAAHTPFAWAPAGFGAFPAPRRARVLWIGVGPGGPPVRRLQADLDAALRQAGLLTGDDKPFTPHLTVGRLRGRGHPVHLPDGWHGPTDRAEAVTVFASELRPDGPRHHVLATAPLRAEG
ncbi:MAG: RNA 2',3'-cyclic phosphodiesterase [Trueperaceae bacterium]|nr:RNA 2',3'-cyclic phosphodiesterase [Trueperaceae bacterium]